MMRKAYRLLMILQGCLWFFMATETALSDSVVLSVAILAFLNGVCYILLGLLDIRTLRK